MYGIVWIQYLKPCNEDLEDGEIWEQFKIPRSTQKNSTNISDVSVQPESKNGMDSEFKMTIVK